MYNYHIDVVWAVNGALAIAIFITIVSICTCVVVKNYLWQRRRRALISIKRDVYEIILSNKPVSQTKSEPFTANLTLQQIIDIETNRNIDAAFFNDSEQQFFRSHIARPEVLSKIEKLAVSSRNKWRKIEALLTLGYAQEESSMEILKSSLFNKDKDVSYFAMISLGQVKTVQSARALFEFLEKDPASGYKVVSILENFPNDISEVALEATGRYDPVVKYWALILLAKLKFSGDIKQIGKLTQDQAAEVRAAACDCLGSSGQKESAPALLKCMADDSWLVKTHAILAYGQVMGDASLPEVTKFISDASWSVLDAVREVMTRHIEASLPYIERFLSGTDEIARKYSVMALEDSGYMSVLLKDAVSNVRGKELAMNILKGVVRSRARRGLDAAVRHLDPAMRVKAVDLLDSIEKA